MAHNLFRFDFFFLIIPLRPSVWETRDITIGGKNPADVNFATIGKQIRFIDTLKHFQQSLGGLAGSLTNSKKAKIRRECHSFLLKQATLYLKFLRLNQEDQDWVLKYLSTGKGVIPYDQMITNFDSLIISPEKEEFFSQHLFYSSLKDSQITTKDYKNLKKFYMLSKLENLGGLNRIYDFQDTIILCEVSEQRSELLKQIFNYNPKKCNSASSFSGCVHHIESK